MTVDPIITRLILKRFRSFPSEQVDFSNPTILVGCNGAGKSNFADVFACLAEAMVSPLHAVFDKRGGIERVRNRTSSRSAPTNLGLAVELGQMNGQVASGRYAFEVKALPGHDFRVLREQCSVFSKTGEHHWFDRNPGFSSNARGLSPSLEPSALCLPVIGGDERFAPVLKTLGSMRRYSIEPSRIREMQDPDRGTSLRPDGGNAASVLQELARSDPDALGRVSELLEAIVPNTRAVRSVKHGNKLTLEFVQEWGKGKDLKFEAADMSDGTLRALGLLMAVFQRPSPSVLVIEEPEATIHPGALGAILDVIQQACSTMQVIVTTHSPELLDAKWIRDSHLRIVSWERGASRVSPLSESTRETIQTHLMGAGELLRSNALHPQELFLDQTDLQVGHLFETLE